MPLVMTPFSALVWMFVAFFAAVGWSLGAWLVARLLR
jgi:hypothetical protein